MAVSTGSVKESAPQPSTESIARGGSLSWSTFIGSQCPVLHRLITDSNGTIDTRAVQRIMERLGLQPCNPDKDDCLERQCSALWKYYVENKNRRPPPPSGEVTNIADHLFSERGNLSFRPGDLSFLYDLHRSTTGDRDSHRIVRRAGEVVLKVESETDLGDVNSYDIMRFLCVEHPQLDAYFVRIYALERTVRKPAQVLVLMESMDGSMLDYREDFGARDRQFWNRFNRMLIHGLVGLQMLHHLGYAFGRVTLENLMYKLEWPTRPDDKRAGLVAVKWRCPREMSTEPARRADDLRSFAMMICELLWGAGNHKITQSKLYELRQPNHLQPLATVAAHFLTTDETRWDIETAMRFIQTHSGEQDILSPIPIEDW